MSTTRTAVRTHWVALRAMLLFTLVLGVAYTIVVTAIGQAILPAQANGSAVRSGDEVVGSALIGQSFTDADGAPLLDRRDEVLVLGAVVAAARSAGVVAVTGGGRAGLELSLIHI